MTQGQAAALSAASIPTLSPFKDAARSRSFFYRTHAIKFLVVNIDFDGESQLNPELLCDEVQVDLFPTADVCAWDDFDNAIKEDDFSTRKFKLTLAAVLDHHIDALERGVTN
jgi:hypothetical protein